MCVTAGRRVRYLLVVVAFALGLMAKPMVVTLPPLLLLLDFWPLARIGSAIDAPGWTSDGRAAGRAAAGVGKAAAGGVGGGRLLDDAANPRRRRHRGSPGRSGSAMRRCLASLTSSMFFYPVDLAAFYPYPAGGPPTWKVAGAVAILASASAAAVVWRRRLSLLALSVGSGILGMLSPVLGLVSVADHAMADRYMYLPGIGLYIALAWAAARLAAGLPARRLAAGRCAAVVIAVLMACAAWQTTFGATTRRCGAMPWRAPPTTTKPNLGWPTRWLDKAGSTRRSLIITGRSSARPRPPPSPIWALLFARQGKLDEAIAQFSQALTIEPDSVAGSIQPGPAF